MSHKNWGRKKRVQDNLGVRIHQSKSGTAILTSDNHSAVPSDPYLRKIGGGMAECTLCNRRFENNTKGRWNHNATKLHKGNLEALKNGKQTE